MTDFLETPHGSKIAYNQSFGKDNSIVFLSGFGSDMQGKKALFIENWAKNNNHSFLRFDYSGHGLSSNNLNDTCFTDWYKDAEFLIKKLTTGKQVLIGSSMGGWVMLMLSKLLPQKVSAMIGLAPAPDFPQNLIWKNMNSLQRRQLILNKSINFVNQNGSNNFFSYNLIKDSFKNLTLSEDIYFNGPINIYHGMKDQDVPYSMSIKILEKIKGSQNVSLLLDKEAGHRLSENDQLDTIINIIKRTLKDI